MFISNQKEVLLKEISKYIKKYNVKSLLDIGAGDGVLAKKLNTIVEKYLGIEKNAEWKENLKGLNITQGEFPCKINGEFDMVLSSHSIPEEKSLYKAFLEQAWSLVKDGGVLVIVTFKGGVLPNGRVHDKELSDELLQILNTFGEIKTKKAISALHGVSHEHIFLSVIKK